MGFPKVLLNRLSRTKGTKVFYIRDYYAVGGVVLGALLGYGIWYSVNEKLRREYEEGLYDNDSDYERKKFYLATGIAIPQTSEQLAARKEQLRDLPEPFIRV